LFPGRYTVVRCATCTLEIIMVFVLKLLTVETAACRGSQIDLNVCHCLFCCKRGLYVQYWLCFCQLQKPQTKLPVLQRKQPAFVPSVLSTTQINTNFSSMFKSPLSKTPFKPPLQSGKKVKENVVSTASLSTADASQLNASSQFQNQSENLKKLWFESSRLEMILLLFSVSILNVIIIASFVVLLSIITLS